MTEQPNAREAVPAQPSVPVWDLPTRITHWAIALLFVFSWVTAENGFMQLHVISGLTILSLLLFRLGWAFIGSPNARIAAFFPWPARVAAYLKEVRAPHYRPKPGHSPLAGLSVLAVWGVLSAHLTLGLFAVDTDGLNSGPLAAMVSFDAGRTASELHETTFTALLVLIGLHLAAIAYFWIGRRINLVRPMVMGTSRVHRSAAELLSDRQILIRSAVLAAAAGLIIYVIAG